MEQDVVQADKELRRKFILFLILFAMIVILVEPTLNRYIEEIKQTSEKNPGLAFKKSVVALKVSLGLVSFLLLIVGIYFIALARRTFKSGQYPPPGMRVIRNTRLRTGTRAERAGISLLVFSCIFIIFACFFLYWPYAFEKTVSKKKSSDTKRNISGKETGGIELKEKGGETK
jgi:hypothetical protein